MNVRRNLHLLWMNHQRKLGKVEEIVKRLGVFWNVKKVGKKKGGKGFRRLEAKLVRSSQNLAIRSLCKVNKKSCWCVQKGESKMCAEPLCNNRSIGGDYLILFYYKFLNIDL